MFSDELINKGNVNMSSYAKILDSGKVSSNSDKLKIVKSNMDTQDYFKQILLL